MNSEPYRSRPRPAGRLAASVAAGLLAGAMDVRAQVSGEEMAALESKLPPPAGLTVDFETHIRPLLENSCLRCHGPERPKGGFRIDTRENALKGGNNSPNDIVPGKSGLSPLVYYSARLVEDMEMPPAGKGDPLTAEQVGLLRAWIDQGVPWSPAVSSSKIAFSVTPSLQWYAVSGNEQQFREHTGIKEGWNGGVQSFSVEQQWGADRKVRVEGKILGNPEAYRLRLEAAQRDLGFVRAGFEQYREYYNDTGGTHPGISPAAFRLDRDLHLDIGRAWVDVGLTLPDRPRLVFGYEHRYREGAKSILQWGDVGQGDEPEANPGTTDAKKTYPNARSIDEQVHLFKFDLQHEVNGLGIHNEFQAELYRNDSSRDTVGFLDLSGNGLNRNFAINERQEHFQASDAFRLEKQLRDWLFVSGGYYFSRLDGEYGLSAQPYFPTGDFLSYNPYYFADAIILEQNTHIINGNVQLGPWSGLTLHGGVQSEWMRQDGFGQVLFGEGFPLSIPPAQGGVAPTPAYLDANLDRLSVEEHVGARYTALPYTVLFAEGRFAQESVGQTEGRAGDRVEFLRDTDASSRLQEGRVGFTLSPWTKASLNVHYKRRGKNSSYDHGAEVDDERFTTDGYSAFITGRTLEADELSAKLALRPAKAVQLGLTYQLIEGQVDTATTAIPAGNFGETPGGETYAARYDSHVYSVNTGLRPWSRLYLASTFSYRQNRTSTGHGYGPVLVDYEGDVYSSISTATFIINSKTDLNAGYTYSWADYAQDNFTAGLPLGLAYHWHMATAGLTRRLRKNVTTNLQYRFYQYDQEHTGGYNNYTAHGVLASLTMVLE